VIEVLDSQIDAIQHASDALIASDPILTEKASLLRSCKGVGPKNAQMILARLPEIGALDRRKIAALVGVAPITCKSGSSINRASIAGGRKPLRDTLFMAALSASLITRRSSPSATGSKPTANPTSSSSSQSSENSSSPSTQ
jgi:transposase